jgi:hypothetical protein
MNGGAGGMQAIWTDSGTGTTYGPGGGGGGSAGITSSNFGTPGQGASYGGGNGDFGSPQGSSGKPLVVLIYTIVKGAPLAPANSNMFLMFG